MPFNVGENVGPYQIIDQLGQGGMATVFKAYHASLDRYVAIKALHPAFSRDPNFESRFQREARVVAKLEHPNIVPIYDYAEHEKRPYLVMKFIDGDTLKARMDSGPLSEGEITRIVDAVGSALSYAHRQGVLHRDIKPSNVLLAEDGQIYLADFGLARMAQSGESTLSSDMLMGTPQYISPEQAMGNSDLDLRTDLYSFGVMLYEMVVGKVPFNADTPFSIIHDHIYSPLPLPSKVNPNVPETVERVLLKALAKEREDRFDDSVMLVRVFKEAWVEAGVPIQGSDLDATAVVPRETGTDSQLEPTKVAESVEPEIIPEKPKVADGVEPIQAEKPGRVDKAEEKSDDLETILKPQRKPSPWIWIGSGIVLVLCIGFLAFARSNHLFASLRPQEQPEADSPTQIRTVEANPPVFELPQDELPPFMVEARDYADNHPDDPEAQLNLAITYWEAGMQRETYDILPRVANAAGPDNRDFYMYAGNEFALREGWIPSAFMFYQAVKSFQAEGDVPVDVLDRFHEAAYKAADRPEAALLVPLDTVSRFDAGIVLIVRARNAFYNGRMDQANEFLADVKRVAPAMLEARLLEAELSAETGEHARARLLAESLLSDRSGAPDWIRIFAEEILKRLP